MFSDVEEDWHDCDEISEESLSVCLFCKHTESDHQLIFSHMCVSINQTRQCIK